MDGTAHSTRSQLSQIDTQSCPSPSTSESKSERLLSRDSPMAVT